MKETTDYTPPNYTPEELAKMTPQERRRALRARAQQSGEQWLKQNCPDTDKKEPQGFKETLNAVNSLFNNSTK